MFKPLRLRQKIALLVSALEAILIAVFAVSSVIIETDKTYEAMSSHGKWVAKILASKMIADMARPALPQPLADIQSGELSNLIDMVIALDSRVACIAVSGKDGRLLAGALNKRWIDYDEKNKAQSLDKILKSNTLYKGFKTITVEINEKDTQYATLKIIFSLSRLREQLRNIVLMWSAAGILFIGISTLGAVMIARRMTVGIGIVSTAMAKVKGGDLTARADFGAVDEVGAMAGIFNDMVEGLREREFIKDTFSRYVSRQVADKILSDKDFKNLKGDRRRVTVLFSDMRGFTGLSEVLPPDVILNMLNEYFSVMVDVVFKYGGMLDKFIGDAAMAVFNAPIDLQCHEMRAIAAALEIQDKMAQINRRRVLEKNIEIDIGIGINTGEAVAGHVGSLERLEYTVIGPGVNLAQRIESQTKKGQILISANTYDAAKFYVDVIMLQPVQLKGIMQPVQLYAVVGLKESAHKLNMLEEVNEKS
ncbi:MAG: HAMP domain-containing protein [Nitrospirae bacterium]|nr:HAMP domain-containing protein [Nitrospirota bacterium]